MLLLLIIVSVGRRKQYDRVHCLRGGLVPCELGAQLLLYPILHRCAPPVHPAGYITSEHPGGPPTAPPHRLMPMDGGVSVHWPVACQKWTLCKSIVSQCFSVVINLCWAEYPQTQLHHVTQCMRAHLCVCLCAFDRWIERGRGERRRKERERVNGEIKEIFKKERERERCIQERVNGEIIGELFHVNCFMRKRELINGRAVGLKEKLLPNMILRNEYEFKSLNETQTKDCHMAFLKPSSTKPSGGGSSDPQVFPNPSPPSWIWIPFSCM